MNWESKFLLNVSHNDIIKTTYPLPGKNITAWITIK